MKVLRDLTYLTIHDVQPGRSRTPSTMSCHGVIEVRGSEFRISRLEFQISGFGFRVAVSG